MPTSLPYAGLAVPVPRWMTAGSGPVRTAAAAVRAHATLLRAVAGQLSGLLAGAAGVLGWRGAASTAAATGAGRAGGRLRQAAIELDAAEQALLGLARGLDDHGATIRSIMARWMYLPAEERPRRQAQLVAATTALTAVDRTVSAQLARVTAALTGMGTLAAEAGWISGEVPPAAVPTLAAAGVVEGPAALAVLATAGSLPDTPAGDRDLRRALAALPLPVLADLLLAHPDLARRLGGDDALPAPAGSPEAGLATVLAASAGLAPAARIGAVRGYFRTLTPQQAGTLALLHPDVIGNLDGAPLAARAAANRVRIAVARDDLLALDARRAEAARTGRGQRPGDGLLWHDDTADKTVATSTRERIAYYTKLLDEPVPDPARTSTHPAGPGGGPGGGSGSALSHRILYFDPGGDGGIADLWGDVGPDTTHVGVLVPGTTTDLGSFPRYSTKAQGFTQGDTTGGTAVITWLGSDAPDAIAHDAPFPDYAERAGPRLRDFVAGLDLPPAVTTTVIGHSYGGAVVGVADREGLDVDRVVLVESPGAGRGVHELGDYHETGRHIEHYDLRAPGDPIAASRVPRFLQDLTGLGHGGNPDTMPGFTRLETGRYDDSPDPSGRGTIISGISSHTEVLTPRSTAWKNLQSLISGGPVTLYSPPEPTDSVPVAPYHDRAFTGPQTTVR